MRRGSDRSQSARRRRCILTGEWREMRRSKDTDKIFEPEIRNVDLSGQGQEIPSGRQHNTELSVVTWIFVLLFMLLIGRVVYILVAESDNLKSNINNTKADSNSDKVIRGDIITSEGTLLATTLLDEYGNHDAYVTATVRDRDVLQPAKIAGGERAEILNFQKTIYLYY